jgi:two-component system nitrate/nitrite response regulator NarL
MVRRVLVIDDHECMRLLFEVAVEDEPTLTLCGVATDGAAGVEMAARLQPDLVICDVEMPQLNGLEALPDIRSAAPNASIVMFSSADDTKSQSEAIARGAKAYFVKGVHDVEDVLAAVQRV